MDVQLRARLGAARLALRDQQGEVRRVLSQTQVVALRALIARDPGMPSCTPEGRAIMMEMAAAVNWHDGHLEEVLHLLEPTGATKKLRRPMQHFAPGIVAYFTAAEWDGPLKQDGGVAMSETVLGRALQLSGRNLTEPSLKFISSFLLYLTHGESSLSWSRSMKKDFFERVKMEFKRRARSADRPEPYLTALPNFPGGVEDKSP